MAEAAIREAAILTFGFRFVNKHGWADSIYLRSGSVTREGLVLDDSKIFYRNIYRVERYKDNIVVVLMPFSAFSRQLSKYILDGFNSFVISVSGFAEEVQSIINRRVSTARLNDRRVGMTEEEIKNVFRKVNCPSCDAAIDLTGLPFSHYIYCIYCDTIFDSFGYEIPGGNEYRVCPESGYYDRIKHYTEYAIYLLRHERSFYVRRYMCGDAYAHLFFEKNFVKNLSLLVGAVLSLIVKVRSSINRNPNYPELVKANLHAMKGEVAEADYIYELLLSRNKHHPGLHYNLGLCYLKSGDQVKALRYFRRSLENCVNYQPTLDIIEKYRTKGQDL